MLYFFTIKVILGFEKSLKKFFKAKQRIIKLILILSFYSKLFVFNLQINSLTVYYLDKMYRFRNFLFENDVHNKQFTIHCCFICKSIV